MGEKVKKQARKKKRDRRMILKRKEQREGEIG